jgi:hypothetical protein
MSSEYISCGIERVTTPSVDVLPCNVILQPQEKFCFVVNAELHFDMRIRHLLSRVHKIMCLSSVAINDARNVFKPLKIFY